MLFCVFAKDELRHLFDALSYNCLVGPTVKEYSPEGQPICAYEQLFDFADLAFEHSTTSHSPKKYFLPHRLIMASYTLEDRSWRKEVRFAPGTPVVFFGMHACDINALNRLDKVLLDTAYPNPFYAARRRNTFIVGTSCSPQPHCFCESMDCETVLHGCDLFITDIGELYFCEIRSSAAYQVLQEIKTAEAEAEHHSLFIQEAKKRKAQFSCRMDTTDLVRILDMEFQADVWQEWGRRCLSCGTCAGVCPTCYCYGTEQVIDLTLDSARKEMRLYSCNLVDFAEVAGGFNFRPESATRLKYRYYHKHRGFVEAFEESLCVGCGRCGQACLADISPVDVIASVRREAEGDG